MTTKQAIDTFVNRELLQKARAWFDVEHEDFGITFKFEQSFLHNQEELKRLEELRPKLEAERAQLLAPDGKERDLGKSPLGEDEQKRLEEIAEEIDMIWPRMVCTRITKTNFSERGQIEEFTPELIKENREIFSDGFLFKLMEFAGAARTPKLPSESS